MMDKLPGMGNMGQAAGQMDVAEKQLSQTEAVINSMTPLERHFPDKINGSRKKRIAAGSGTDIQTINRVLKQHKQMQKVMKKMTGKGGMRKMMGAMKGMGGPGGPGGGMPPMGGMGGGGFPFK
jgi:signal recognition particle subunit SRP54